MTDDAEQREVKARSGPARANKPGEVDEVGADAGLQQEERERLEDELRQRAKHTTHQKPGQQYAAESDATASIRPDEAADHER